MRMVGQGKLGKMTDQGEAEQSAGEKKGYGLAEGVAEQDQALWQCGAWQVRANAMTGEGRA